MASAGKQSILSLFQAHGHVTDGALTFEEAIQATQGLKLMGPHEKPLKKDRRHIQGSLKLGDLPLKEIQGTKLVIFCDVLLDVDGPINGQDVFTKCLHGEYSELPEPLRLKHEPAVPYTMQLFLLPADPSSVNEDSPDAYVGKYHVLKYVNLQKNRVDVSAIKTYCYGHAMQVDYGKNFRSGQMIVQYMLEQLEGFQLKYYTVGPLHQKAVAISQEARAAGYAFIREKGPRANNNNQFMEWADTQVNDENSAIFGWQESRVKEALGNYSRGRSNAKAIEFWPFTLRNFSAWFLNDILRGMLGNLNQFGLTWIGITRVGKSAGSKIVAMTQSRYEIEQDGLTDVVPSMVTAKHLDFFKAEPVTKWKPAVFDDGLLQAQNPDLLKAFVNPSEEDATMWARWGSAQFDRGASRQVCSNPYCKVTEEKAVEEARDNTISHARFMELVMPSFAAVKEPADFEAILARSHILVLTDKHIFYRHAEPRHVHVPFIQWPNLNQKDLLSEETRPDWLEYKRNPGSQTYPARYHEDAIWSQEYLKRVIRGEPIPIVATVRISNLFSSQAGIVQMAPPLMPSSEMQVKIKKEKVIAFHRKLSRFHATTIDLDASPDAKKPRQEISATDERVSNPSSSSGLRNPASAVEHAPASSSSSGLHNPAPAIEHDLHLPEEEDPLNLGFSMQ